MIHDKPSNYGKLSENRMAIPAVSFPGLKA